MPKCSALPQILALLGGVAFAACQWLVFAYAPELFCGICVLSGLSVAA